MPETVKFLFTVVRSVWLSYSVGVQDPVCLGDWPYVAFRLQGHGTVVV